MKVGNGKNVLWILTDQQRAETLSINGCENTYTPNLDMLARTGINLTDAVSGYPLCCPYRGSLITSTYPHNCVPGHEYPLPDDIPTIANVFNEVGYDTFWLGKWHLDGFKEDMGIRAVHHKVPKERRGGFKSWLGYENNNAQYDCYLHGHRKDTEVEHFKLQTYETDALTDLMIEYLEARSNDKKPFFAALSVQPPHDPYVAPPEFGKHHRPADIKLRPNVPEVASIKEQARRDLAGYYAMVENVDDNVGRIYQFLEKTGLIEDTHLIFFSDHGDMHGSHGQFRKMVPYQESINVPFIITGEKTAGWQEARQTGNVSNVPINHVDIAPTTLGLCDIPVPAWMKGTDYSALRYGDRSLPDYPDSAYLQTVIPHGNDVNKAWRGIVTTEGYKYACFEGCDWMLYDLNTDPYEQNNLVHNNNDFNKELRLKLRKRLAQWIEETGDVFELPTN